MVSDLSQLISAVRQGETSAGALVVSMYGRRLMHYIRLVAPNLSEVDQEMLAERTIEAALANIDRYDETRSSFDSWVRGYVRLKLLEHYRTSPVGVSVDQYDGQDWAQVAQLSSDETGENATLLRAVAQALQSLPATDQLIISLRDINGLAYQAIADQLNVSVDACRQRHRRAIAALRRSLTDGRSRQLLALKTGQYQPESDPQTVEERTND